MPTQNQVTSYNSEAQKKSLLSFSNKISLTDNFVSYDTKVEVIGNFSHPTMLQFSAYQKAFDYFNRKLFDKKLPPVLLSLTRSRISNYGYFKPDSWKDEYGNVWNEISLNPKRLGRPAAEVYSTLVHEQAHHYQQIFLKPGRGGYHNKQFAQIMEKLGLMCSCTGKPGGKKTGQQMTHYIIPDGPFDQAYRIIPEEYKLPFKLTEIIEDRVFVQSEEENANNKNKIKYCCNECNNTVWGKPGMVVFCAGNIKNQHNPTPMTKNQKINF